MRGYYWDTGEVVYLVKHRADGATAIAAHLGRSVKSVYKMAERMQLPLGGHEERQRRREYVKAHCNTMSIKAMADALGTTEDVIIKIMQEI